MRHLMVKSLLLSFSVIFPIDPKKPYKGSKASHYSILSATEELNFITKLPTQDTGQWNPLFATII